jgi:S-layer homology domain
VRNADPSTEPGSGEGLWSNEIYNKLGYSGFSGRWTKGQEFNGDTRNTDHTDWAFTIFIADSLNDSNGYFADNYFAYAWLGGPHLVKTYDNDGWGISQMNLVARHEGSHTFYALDEYGSSGCACSDTSGYSNYQDLNCENSCTYNGNCIMSSATKQQANVICSFTRGMIGWGDTDGDNKPDPLDIRPQTALTAYTPDPTLNTTLTYQGSASIQTLTNQNQYNYRCDVNVLHIGGVHYSVDNGRWLAASPSDGTWDSGQEAYTFTTAILVPGIHTIRTRAFDEIGNPDDTPAFDSVTVQSQSLALYSNRPAVNDSGSTTPNGIIEPNESVTLTGNLLNISSSPANSVTGALTTTDPITIVNGSAIYPTITGGGSQSCTTCYSITAPLANRPAVHWDFAVKETPTCSGCAAKNYDFIYHVGNSFADVSVSSLFYSYMESLLHSGITGGCSASSYCPLNTVSREQMAKFICRAINIKSPGTCVPSACKSIFSDVPGSDIFCPDIEALYNTGVVAGCAAAPLSYCPLNTTQRQAMAKFICNAMNTVNPGSCNAASCTGVFNDVTSSNPFCIYIEALYNASVASGCGTNLYCPANNVSREQMSKFLVNAFSLVL